MSDLSHEARLLIEEARPAEPPDASMKRRVHVALFAQLSLPPGGLPPQPGPAVGSAAASVAVVTGTKLVLLCTLTAAAVVGGGAGLHHWASSRQSSTPPNRHVPAPQLPQGQPSLLAGEVFSPPPPSQTKGLVQVKEDTRRSVPTERPSMPRLQRSSIGTSAAARVEPDRLNKPNHGPAEKPLPLAPPLAASAPYEPAVVPVPEPGVRPLSKPALSAEHRAPEAPRLPMARAKTGCSAKEEIGLLADAQTALREGRGTLALAMLDQHRALCPSARFREEHSTAHILALCLLHRREEALAEAAGLAAEVPRSPQLARLRTSCAAAAVEQVARGKAGP